MDNIGRKPQTVRFSDLCNFTPRQLEAEAAADTHLYTLYGGSRGPGKSYFLRWWSVKRLLKLAKRGVTGAVGGLFCEDYPSLRDRHIGKISTEFPEWLGAIRESKEHGLAYHIGKPYGGGVLKLRNLDDPSKYQSSEFAFAAVDELTKNRVSTFDILRGSLRWPGVPDVRFVGATNPGGIGHLWVKSYWVDGVLPQELAKYKDQFAFVRALPTDNPHLEQSYWDMLESLPPDLAEAWVRGSWDVFEGQFFQELSKERHGFYGDPPPGRTFCSMDYGESAPAAVYWWRVDSEGDVWVYRELYGSGMIYSVLKTKMHLLTPPGEQVEYTVCSPDIFAKSKGTGVVGAEVFNSDSVDYGGFSWPVQAADNNRLEGWRHMKEFIHLGRLHVSLDACPNFWRTAPAMVYDKRHTEDMDGKGEDHSVESIRYGLMSRPQPAPKEQQSIPPDDRTDKGLDARLAYLNPPENDDYY